MTKQELYAIWERGMHRNDLAADLDDVYLFASEVSVNSMMYADATVDDLLLTAPQIMVHAGLMYLAELAQDDVQLERETMKFRTSTGDWQMRRSVQTLSPAMQRA